MEIFKYIITAILIICGIAILFFCAKGGRFFKSLLINAAAGIAVLILINITTRFTGVHIPVNEWTAAGAAIYGLPMVCGFVIIPIIFK